MTTESDSTTVNTVKGSLSTNSQPKPSDPLDVYMTSITNLNYSSSSTVTGTSGAKKLTFLVGSMNRERGSKLQVWMEWEAELKREI